MPVQAPLDFNALPVPADYVAGSLRNDSGFSLSGVTRNSSTLDAPKLPQLTVSIDVFAADDALIRNRRRQTPQAAPAAATAAKLAATAAELRGVVAGVWDAVPEALDMTGRRAEQRKEGSEQFERVFGGAGERAGVDRGEGLRAAAVNTDTTYAWKEYLNHVSDTEGPTAASSALVSAADSGSDAAASLAGSYLSPTDAATLLRRALSLRPSATLAAALIRVLPPVSALSAAPPEFITHPSVVLAVLARAPAAAEPLLAGAAARPPFPANEGALLLALLLVQRRVELAPVHHTSASPLVRAAAAALAAAAPAAALVSGARTAFSSRDEVGQIDRCIEELTNSGLAEMFGALYHPMLLHLHAARGALAAAPATAPTTLCDTTAAAVVGAGLAQGDQEVLRCGLVTFESDELAVQVFSECLAFTVPQPQLLETGMLLACRAGPEACNRILERVKLPDSCSHDPDLARALAAAAALAATAAPANHIAFCVAATSDACISVLKHFSGELPPSASARLSRVPPPPAPASLAAALGDPRKLRAVARAPAPARQLSRPDSLSPAEVAALAQGLSADPGTRWAALPDWVAAAAGRAAAAPPAPRQILARLMAGQEPPASLDLPIVCDGTAFAAAVARETVLPAGGGVDGAVALVLGTVEDAKLVHRQYICGARSSGGLWRGLLLLDGFLALGQPWERMWQPGKPKERLQQLLDRLMQHKLLR